jgi:hypothetical protein
MLVANNKNLNLSIKNWLYINMMIMSTFVNIYIENAFIITSQFLNFKNMNWLIDWIINKLNNSY